MSRSHASWQVLVDLRLPQHGLLLLAHFGLQRHLWAEGQLAPPKQLHGRWTLLVCQTY